MLSILIKGATALIVILAFAMLSGVVVWATWDSLFTMIPAASLYFPSNPSLWVCIKFMWLLGFIGSALFKSTSSGGS